MISLQRDDWARRLYQRLPEFYRSSDLEVARRRDPRADEHSGPLFSLLQAIAGQVAVVRQDMDDVWDNYFIETCEDWVVPYLGDLLGTNLIPNAAGRTNRLDVRNTILWRRSKGTPAMLAAMARDTTSWPTELAEFFRTLGWIQNLNHVRVDRPLTVSLTDAFAVDQLGRSGDIWAHLVSLGSARDLDAARLARAPGATGAGGAIGGARASWGTPGRYRPNRIGFFVSGLRTFRIAGGTPVPLGGRAYAFDPLGRSTPLFARGSGRAIRRTDLEHASVRHWEESVTVRRYGIPLAMATTRQGTGSESREPFRFGDAASVALDPVHGLRLLDPSVFRQGAEHFRVTAVMRTPSGDEPLGHLDTVLARLGLDGFAVDGSATHVGQLVLKIETGPGAGERAAAGPGRLPPTTLRIRNNEPIPRVAIEGSGWPSTRSVYRDALLIYVPGAFIRPGQPQEFFVADDGSTYGSASLSHDTLLRASEGQIWPAADLSRPSSLPEELALGLHRRAGLCLPDPARIAGFALLIEAHLLAGVPQLLGALVTDDLALSGLPGPLDDALRELSTGALGAVWPARQFVPSAAAERDDLPASGQLVVRLRPSASAASLDVPQFEVVVTDRAGDARLVYIPAVNFSQARPDAWFYVADDGSTYRAGSLTPAALPDSGQLPAASLARVAAGQVLPIEGVFPLQRRRIAARPDCLAIDPEGGRFCLPAGDPLLDVSPEARALTVDYVEAFADRIGAHAFDRGSESEQGPATRLVSASGDAATTLPFWRIHSSVAAALAQATDGEVIEIADSATYDERLSIDLFAKDITSLIIRAADRPRITRPTLAPAAGAAIGIRSRSGAQIQLVGVLVAGAGLSLVGAFDEVTISSSTFARDLDGRGGAIDVASTATDPSGRMVICRSVCGPVRIGSGVTRVVVADSIVDGREGLALGGTGSDATSDAPAPSLQLERATVLGRIRCERLTASESLLAGIATVDDRQSGCVRFSRYEAGSRLPRRYRCVPGDADGQHGSRARPAFASLLPWSPEYAQLGPGTDAEVLRASEEGDQVGAFTSTYPGLRTGNLRMKLQEFLPAGLEPVIIAET